MNSEIIRATLTKHLPAPAVNYCLTLWETRRFDFKQTKRRATKIGDFCFQSGKVPRITVNEDLEPFLFLTTYIHEIAHLDVHMKFGRRAEAHGEEWKESFRQLLFPVLDDHCFPPDLLVALKEHMRDPMATMYSDAPLMAVFRRYDKRTEAMTLLSQIPKGSIFQLRGRWFRKEETKRTRVMCQEVKTKRKYLVPADAAVNNVQLSLL